MRFKQELKKNMKFGFLAIGIIFIFMGGFYFNAVQGDFKNQCSECLTQDCQDNDVVCGDFGVYYFKFASLIGMSGVAFMIFILPYKKEDID